MFSAHRRRVDCAKVTRPVIWLSLWTKDDSVGTGGCSLSRKQAGSVSHGASPRGMNTGWLPRRTGWGGGLVLTPRSGWKAITCHDERWIKHITHSQPVKRRPLPVGIDGRRLWDHGCHLKLVGHVAERHSHLGCLDHRLHICQRF